MIERIDHGDMLLALILRAEVRQQGVTFFTPPELSQQLAYIAHPQGHQIQPHTHKPVTREVHNTQEVLFLRRGRLRVDFYDTTQRYLCSRELAAGDVILLAAGGHGFEVLEAVEMFEVKQGPYDDSHDKERFAGIAADQVKWA
ncbi:hypothetical protein [Zavarzinia sp. CC-PAN008]|uniref:hypothetical protein n=1 Tax=Zavarzinia sp. CC-PAN008 TaxID=3243332 RepID=UPI003F74584B